MLGVPMQELMLKHTTPPGLKTRLNSAGLLWVFLWSMKKKERPSNQTSFLLYGRFNFCTFQSNRYSSKGYSLVSVGAVHMGGSMVELCNSKFLYTLGTALYLLDSSYVVIRHFSQTLTQYEVGLSTWTRAHSLL